MTVFDISAKQLMLTLSKTRKGMLSAPHYNEHLNTRFAHPVNEYTPIECLSLLCWLS